MRYLIERLRKQLSSLHVRSLSYSSAESGTAYELWSWGRGADGATGSDSWGDCEGAQPTGTRWTSPSLPRVHAGMWHSGAVINGEAYMWGKGKGGRLGLGDEAARYSPAALSVPDADILSLSLGGQHSAAIASTGQLLTWGYGDFGCLGHGGYNPELEPRAVESLYIDDTVSQAVYADEVNKEPLVATGGAHTLVVDRHGRVFACGRDEGDGRLGIRNSALSNENLLNAFVQVPLAEPAVAIEAGGFASFAITVSGRVLSWGSNGNGELGIGTWGWSGHKAQVIDKLASRHIVQIAAGGFHVAALTSDGEVFTWGLGKYGALGHGSTSKDATPRRVAALRGVTILQISCGPTSTCAVSDRGELFVWGNNASGGLGLTGESAKATEVVTPELVTQMSGVVSAATGAMHGVALVQCS